MDVHGGAVVYVHDGGDSAGDEDAADRSPFGYRKYVQAISFLISTTGNYRFYHCSKWECPLPREYRLRFDEKDKLIEYPDF
ncbi:hypothetical protein [Chitinimonas koreensis]|nr:hypothetical protein [Chitinimonas koreensis]QNM95972.1 hypothetical protein H9L41_19460 [Chitinimonas koreensis]